MDCPSQYHAILGWPAFSRFMAVPHYTYLVLKMPGPNGIITVKGSFELSNICDKEFHKMAGHKHSAQQQNMENQREDQSVAHHTLQFNQCQIKLSTARLKQRNFESIRRIRTILHQTSLGLLPLRRHFLSKASQPKISS
jgi:hypothetical protein